MSASDSPFVNFERFTNRRIPNDSRSCQTPGVSPAKLEDLCLIKKLLIDSTGVSGLHPPGIAEGYDFVENISSHAKSTVKIAHVASPKWALNWLPAGQLPGHL